MTEIEIQTIALKKGKPDRRKFKCIANDLGDYRTYFLPEETNRTLMRKRFALERGCKIYDGDNILRVEWVKFTTPRPMIPIILAVPLPP